uniref:EOG090X06CC n=1 Tax=Daphnia pulex TaxID=6669 RepID=A0A4Y7MW56_DAPPU|nr:EOG090X06CC [Daphnia pulex]SVE84873.1 EOG090X06CC [Daphnia pulex]
MDEKEPNWLRLPRENGTVLTLELPETIQEITSFMKLQEKIKKLRLQIAPDPFDKGSIRLAYYGKIYYPVSKDENSSTSASADIVDDVVFKEIISLPKVEELDRQRYVTDLERIGVLGQRAVGDKRPSIGGYGQSMIGGSYFNLPASAPSGLGQAGLAGVRGAFQGLAHGQGTQSQGVQGLQMPFGMPLGMDGSLAPPSLDLSEFPSLTNRSMGPNENGGSSSLTGRSNYVGIIKTPASETTEFTMSNEDFPALPGTQNNDNNTSTGSGAETSKVSNTSTSSSSVSNTNLNHSKRGLQISADGKVTNIPNNMVADQFGMAGLLTFIRVAESDSNLVSLALGSDLTTLGLNLNSPEPLYNNFGGPWAENPCRPQDIDFHVPPEYLTNAVIRDKLAPVKLNRYQEDLLFYLFYTNVGDTMQLAASLELYNRDWRYHKEERLWITRVPGMPLMEKTGTYERGTYYCFDPNNWRKVAKEMFVEYERLEDRPRDLQMPAMVLPSAAPQGV